MNTDGKLLWAMIGTESLRARELQTILDKNSSTPADIEFFDPGVEEEYSRLTRFRGEPRIIQTPSFELLEETDLLFLASDRKTNRKFGRWAAGKNISAIDLGESFTGDENVPVVVAGVNDEREPVRTASLVANPHPVTIMLTQVFHALLSRFGLSGARAFVLQPVSVFGDPGIQELAGQSFDMLNCASIQSGIFKRQIAFNMLSHMEPVDRNGLSATERRILDQVDAVLSGPPFPFSVSLIQAPVFHAYSMMIHMELDTSAGSGAVADAFRENDRFVYTSPGRSGSVSPVESAGKDKILIGQLKRDSSTPNGYWLWVVADNLICGSALNAFEAAVRKVRM